MRRILLVILTVLLCLPAQAQFAYRVDTLSVPKAKLSSDFDARQIIAPAALVTTGVLIHCFGHDSFDESIRKWATEDWRGDKPSRRFDDYVQYAPLAMNLGLGFAGVPTEHHWIDRFIETGISYASLTILSRGMKAVINSPRPDGVDNKSFPSGHTGLAFTGAELVRMEYGWGWGGAAYALATSVAFMRLYNNKHWASDLIFGAGLGILCAHIGGWLLEPTKNLFGIKIPDKMQFALAPAVDPFSGSLCGTLAMKF